MGKIKIGILGTSDIAYRRFLPALLKCGDFEYVGIASRSLEKTQPFIDSFEGIGYGSYDELLTDDRIDTVYIPLPPALHFQWGKKALENGKHILMEKPFTTSVKDTRILLELAQEKNLAVHENYMFLYHSQLAWLKEEIQKKTIGEIRLMRSSFGFPKRAANDFRYNKALGGGALLDCGGYPVRLASELLGKTAKIVASRLQYSDEFDVDIGGSAMLENSKGQVAQIAFGMDNSYKCNVELWGSTGYINLQRIFTSPNEIAPSAEKQISNGNLKSFFLEKDDAFLNSLTSFAESINSAEYRKTKAYMIEYQSNLIEKIKEGNI